MDKKLADFLKSRSLTEERENHFLESLVGDDRREEYLKAKESYRMVLRHLWAHGYATALRDMKENGKVGE